MKRLIQLAVVSTAALALAACETGTNTASNGQSGSTGLSLGAPAAKVDSRNINNVVPILARFGDAENDTDFATPTILADSRGLVYFVDFEGCASKTNCKSYTVNTFWEPSELGRTAFSKDQASKWMSSNPGGKVYVDFEGDLILEVAARTNSADNPAAVRGTVQRFLTLARKIEKDFAGAQSKQPLPVFAKASRKAD